MEIALEAEALVAAAAEGKALVSQEPLSFWGGYDQTSGEIIDRRHPLSGEIAAGRILAIPSTRGSSTTAAVFLEAVRAGTAPAAVITRSIDVFLSLASIVADEMYGKPVPIVELSSEDFAQLRTGQWIRVSEGGRLDITASSNSE